MGNGINKASQDIGLDELPNRKRKTSSKKVCPKTVATTKILEQQKKNKLVVVLTISILCELISIFVSPILLTISPVANLVAGICIVNLISLNAKKKIENYGKLAIVSGLILSIISGCILLHVWQNLSTTGYELIPILLFYAFTFPAAFVFAIATIKGILRSRKSSKTSRALMLNIVGLILLIIAFTLPILTQLL